MAELVTANQPFQGVDGKPIVNGFIFVGKAKADTILNPINIFSDRQLTIALDNPQRTDSLGRPVNKIWGIAPYSVLVQDVNSVQRFTDDDTGESEAAGLITLTNVQGLNSITAEGIPSITGYVDKALYIFTTAGINTGNVTLNIDNQGIIPVKKEHDKEISPGNFEAGQIIVVSFNALTTTFELISGVANEGQLQITIWSGSIADIPQGFQLCDGTNGTPNLKDFFVLGAGGTKNPGDTGGLLVTGGHVLTVGELAAHFHTHTRVVSQSQNANLDNDVLATANFGTGNTSIVGSNAAHTHPQNLPPFFALAFIMKL